ncbi:MAG: hypothetical protein WBE34_06230 [Candidatus Nitrosopolaris sp.]
MSVAPRQYLIKFMSTHLITYSLFPLKKVGQNTFELSGISGIKTLEVHVLLPDNNNNTFLLPSW